MNLDLVGYLCMNFSGSSWDMIGILGSCLQSTVGDATMLGVDDATIIHGDEGDTL